MSKTFYCCKASSQRKSAMTPRTRSSDTQHQEGRPRRIPKKTPHEQRSSASRIHARLPSKKKMSEKQSEVRALGTKVLQPSVSLSPGAAFRTSFIICTVCSTSAIVSPGMPTIPYSFSASSPPSWALTAAVTMSACSNFLLTILRGRNAQSD
jgi:hypothetical protein